jgi:2-amino-4-hydroxy-6-hydroxymethyldihydropteridine diphosphokinase
MNTLYLSMGSNLGDSIQNLQNGILLIEKCLGKVTNVSSIYRTAPMYLENQPAFLNCALELKTQSELQEALETCKQIEKEIGRQQTIKYGPRELDIDIICAVDEHNEPIELNTNTLQIPHPKATERKFVLEPLAEINPNLILENDQTVMDFLIQEHIQNQQCEKLDDAVLSILSN